MLSGWSGRRASDGQTETAAERWAIALPAQAAAQGNVSMHGNSVMTARWIMTGTTVQRTGFLAPVG